MRIPARALAPALLALGLLIGGCADEPSAPPPQETVPATAPMEPGGWMSEDADWSDSTLPPECRPGAGDWTPEREAFCNDWFDSELDAAIEEQCKDPELAAIYEECQGTPAPAPSVGDEGFEEPGGDGFTSDGLEGECSDPGSSAYGSGACGGGSSSGESQYEYGCEQGYIPAEQC